MPGPKMGPRPADFCEDLVRQSPTFVKWESLRNGEKLRYACRDFIRGHDQDEERLMRRIMIARRNNLRDHAILKRARKKQDEPGEVKAEPVVEAVAAPAPTTPRKRRPTTTFSDSQVVMEMDVAAVEATRSYKAWMALPDEAEFVYNQKYYKGRPNQDWLLRKNIWRRMRYRRENKKMVNKLREDDPKISAPPVPSSQPTASEIVDQALSPLKQEADASSSAEAASVTPPNGASDPTVANAEQHLAGSKRASEGEEVLEHERPTKVVRSEAMKLPQPVARVFNPVQNPVPEAVSDVDAALPEGTPALSMPPPPPEEHHTHHPALSATTSTDEDTAHAALTAAAAATASGAADDLVELSAVEAAVAAAASYVQLATHQNDNEEDDVYGDADEDDHDLDPGHHHTPSVHNPLEAAANAAALDSAAKLAAAATAQEVAAAAQQVADGHHHQHQEALVLQATDDLVEAV